MAVWNEKEKIKLERLLDRMDAGFELRTTIQQLVQFGLKASCTESALLDCLEISSGPLNDIALKALTKLWSPILDTNPLHKAAKLTVLGKTNWNKYELRQLLKQEGLIYAPKLEESVSHVLIGKGLKTEERMLLMENRDSITCLSEALLLQFFKSSNHAFLLNGEDALSQQKHVEAMLLSPDVANVSIALSLIKSGGLPKSLLTALFIVYKFSEQEDLWKEAQKLLLLEASALLKSRLTKLRKLQEAQDYQSLLEGTELAEWKILQYDYLVKGAYHLPISEIIDKTPPEFRIVFLEEAMKHWQVDENAKVLWLPDDFDFGNYYPQVYSLSHIEVLRLRPIYRYRMQELPQGISAMSNLRELDLYISLKSFPKELSLLPKLEQLNINMISIKEMDMLFDKGFTALKVLNLKYYRYKTLPKGLSKLKGLTSLEISRSDLEDLPMELAKLEQLDYLILTENIFEKIPKVLFEMKQLKKLFLNRRAPWPAHLLDDIERLKIALPNCFVCV